MSIFARTARMLVLKPFATLATLAAAGVWGTIAVNAVFLQPGPHPAPLLGAPQDSRVLAAPERLPQARPEREASTVSPASYEEDSRRRKLERELALVRDVQRSLAERGFYDGPVDGLDGPKTAAAIRAYERTAGLKETGEASESLLTHIELSSFESTPVPPPSPARGEAGPGEPAAEETEPSMAALIEATRDVAPTDERPQASGSADIAPDDAEPEVPPDPRVRAVQEVLADLGYAPGVIDGYIGPDTKGALRRFEIDRGLPPTGEISDRLLRELSAVSGVTLG